MNKQTNKKLNKVFDLLDFVYYPKLNGGTSRIT